MAPNIGGLGQQRIDSDGEPGAATEDRCYPSIIGSLSGWLRAARNIRPRRLVDVIS
jgi:hypothetical protein